jgi:glycine cleavage system transcriptional repressor
MHYLLTAAGPDRTGIVAEVTKLLFGLGCNLEDSAMTRLRGEFAILLLFSAPDAVGEADLRAKLQALEKQGLVLQLKPLGPSELKESARPGALCLVTVYGADKPGIVFKVTELLADKKFNVTDLSTHRTDAPKAGAPAGYILYIEGEVASPAAVGEIDKALQSLGKSIGVTVSIKTLDPVPL